MTARRSNSKQNKQKKATPGRPWLVLPIGLGLAAAAAYVLLTGEPSLSTGASRVGGSEPADEIREASRDQLREILREAEDSP